MTDNAQGGAPAAGAGAATPAAAQPAAAAPAAAPLPTGVVPTQQWYGGFENAELRGYAETKGWQTPEAAIESYRNLEKLTGVPADQIIRMPKPDDKEGWNALYSRLGKPATPNEYGLPVPDGAPKDLADGLAPIFHENNVPKDAAANITKALYEALANSEATSAEQAAATAKQQDAELRSKEWGAAYEKNVQIARRAQVALGLDASTVDALEGALGYAGVLKFLHNIGAKIGEDTFVSQGGQGDFGGVMTPAAARARIDALKGDPTFVKNYTNGGAAERAEMERLHKMANPDL
jgi:hypothetical protein